MPAWWHLLVQLSKSVCFMYHQQKSQHLAGIVPFGFRGMFITIACWHRLVWIQILCYVLHAIVLKWLWPTQELLTSLKLTSMLEFWYGSFDTIFAWDESSSLVLTNVLYSSAGLWTGSRESCKFCIHANYLSLVVKLAWFWFFCPIDINQIQHFNFRFSGIHLWTNQYLIHQQLFFFMASLEAGKTGVNEESSMCL